MNKLMLIDGNSLLHRAFYAMPLLSTKDGQYTNAVYGFMNMFYSALQQVSPTHVAVAFDRREPTFRHRAFSEYKAGRKETPAELGPQFSLLREVLEEMHVSTIDLAGYEADDLIGTLSRISDESGGECVILSGDKDNLQLVSPLTTVWITKKGISQTEKYTPEHLMESMGLSPAQIIDLKALAGDSSDNIPGIAGVGEKTALRLIAEYGSVQQILDNAGNIKGKLGEKVAASKEIALLSKDLATINRQVPITFTLDDCIYQPLNTEALHKLFASLEFKSLLAKLPKVAQPTAPIQSFAPAQTDDILDEAALSTLKQRFQGDTIAICMDMGDTTSYVYLAENQTQQVRIPLSLTFAFEGFTPDILLPVLRELIVGKKVISYDIKQLMHELECTDITPEGDIMVAQYLLDCIKGSYPLQDILAQYEVASGACAIVHIHNQQCDQLAQAEMTALYRDMELPLIKVLYCMEISGFTVNRNMLLELGDTYAKKLSALSDQIFTLAGETFNINSPKQLGEILFERLGLPHGRKTKTGYSTDVEVLQRLQDDHAIIEPVMEYRQLQKLKSTYIDALVGILDASERVHSSFNQTITATGRISSTDPNLQNIPVRYELGRIIRKAFVPQEGYVLLDGDYSQIELRVLAHMSGDQALIAAFQQGEDIHTATAASVFGVPLSLVTVEQRSAAKAVNFGIVYGISDFGLARNIGVPVYVAAQYIKDYFEQYPQVQEFMERCKAEAKLSGYAITMLGRRRPCPELQSANYNTRSFGERVAMNTPVQGTAADIIKLAMIRVFNTLQAKGMKTRLILQVHDELILEAPLAEVEQAKALLKECMESCYTLHVPLLVEVNAGMSWFDTK